jgi:hypothetical protein
MITLKKNCIMIATLSESTGGLRAGWGVEA